ncbi:MAG TPA: HAD family hydrolase, partial [Phycisphaerae bacterium]|nr:HAD family hydrolase [Phycisphaerae bacterium]
YYTREQWPDVLAQATEEVAAYLRARGLLRVDPGELAGRVEAERGEREDLRVTPLAERLGRIFSLSQADLREGEDLELCRRFMKPIFSLARLHDDSLATLAELRHRGLRTGILSNTPWGSPAELWREELRRHGLLDAVDGAVFCRDAGWRKPARQPFELILRKLDVTAARSLFVGDDPRWDIVGPRGVGMEAILIDRTMSTPPADVVTIRSLAELPARL